MTQLPDIATLDAWLKKNVPMIDYAQLTIAELNTEKCLVVIPYLPQNKNHLQSIYFGALAIGADAAAGLLAFYHSTLSGQQLNILFKDFKASFLKRAHEDLYFLCKDAALIQQAVAEAITSGKRINVTVNVVAFIQNQPDDIIAEFVMTLSMKLPSD